MNNKVSSVIITYYPDLKNLVSLILSLQSSGVFCCVIDNASDFDLECLPKGIFISRLCKNEGIAKAQNIAIRKILSDGFEKIVFFDQDSVVNEGFIAALEKSFIDPHVSIVAPVFFDRSKGFGYDLVDINKFGFRRKISPLKLNNSIDISVAISSGTMVNSRIFFLVGLMDERFFIDYVDTEWCLRCASKGIFVRVNPDAKMLHSIGDSSLSFCGYNIPVHSPIRRYYRLRNSFLLIRLRHVPIFLSLREIFFSFIHQGIIFVVSEKRSEYIYYFLRALRDGFLGAWGRIK